MHPIFDRLFRGGQKKDASPQQPTKPTFLTRLPPELRIQIHSYLSYTDIQSLRSSLSLIFNTFPAPTVAHLLDMKTRETYQYLEFKLLGCSECLKLLPAIDFYVAYSPAYSNMSLPISALRRGRFCGKCATRQLPGPHRYQKGDCWLDWNEVEWARCVKCAHKYRAEEGCEMCLMRSWKGRRDLKLRDQLFARGANVVIVNNRVYQKPLEVTTITLQFNLELS